LLVVTDGYGQFSLAYRERHPVEPVAYYHTFVSHQWGTMSDLDYAYQFDGKWRRSMISSRQSSATAGEIPHMRGASCRGSTRRATLRIQHAITHPFWAKSCLAPNPRSCETSTPTLRRISSSLTIRTRRLESLSSSLKVAIRSSTPRVTGACTDARPRVDLRIRRRRRCLRPTSGCHLSEQPDTCAMRPAL